MAQAIAKRYAKALFELLAGEGLKDFDPARAESMKGALQKFADLWSQNKELRDALTNPAISEQERVAVVGDLANKLHGDGDLLKNLLSLLVVNGRLSSSQEISDHFTAMVNEARDVLSLEIVTAFPVSETEKRELEEKVRRGVGKMSEISWSVDPALLGGAVVKAGDRMLDSSVRGSLERLAAQMTA